MIYAVLEQALNPDELKAALARLFSVAPHQILMDEEYATDWYDNISDDSRLLCHFSLNPNGQFLTRLEAIPFDNLKPQFDQYEGIGRLCEILESAALIHDSNRYSPFHWIVIRKRNDFSRVGVNPDMLNKEPVDTNFQISHKYLCFYADRVVSSEKLANAVSVVFQRSKNEVEVFVENLWNHKQSLHKVRVEVKKCDGEFAQCIRIVMTANNLTNLPKVSDVELVAKLCHLLNVNAATYGLTYDHLISSQGDVYRSIKIVETRDHEQFHLRITTDD